MTCRSIDSLFTDRLTEALKDEDSHRFLLWCGLVTLWRIAAYAYLPETGSDATYASLDEDWGLVGRDKGNFTDLKNSFQGQSPGRLPSPAQRAGFGEGLPFRGNAPAIYKDAIIGANDRGVAPN